MLIINQSFIFHSIVDEAFVKGSQLDCLFPWPYNYRYIEFKLRYLTNLKLFSIRVKELLEPIVWLKKK